MSQSPYIIAMMIDTTIAYIAGLFDGEGSVRLRLRERTRVGHSRGRIYNHHQKEFELQTQITNKNIDCLNLCKDRYGGRIYKVARKVPIYRWMTEGTKALAFLNEIHPYVIIKKPHIDAILNNPENKEYASRLLRVFNTRGVAEYPKSPLM